MFSIFRRRTSLLQQDGSELVVPYAVATGDVESLVRHFTNLGLLQVNMIQNSFYMYLNCEIESCCEVFENILIYPHNSLGLSIC